MKFSVEMVELTCLPSADMPSPELTDTLVKLILAVAIYGFSHKTNSAPRFEFSLEEERSIVTNQLPKNELEMICQKAQKIVI